MNPHVVPLASQLYEARVNTIVPAGSPGSVQALTEKATTGTIARASTRDAYLLIAVPST